MKIYFLKNTIELVDNIHLVLSNKDISLLENLTEQKSSFFEGKLIVDKNGETHPGIIGFLEKKGIKLIYDFSKKKKTSK